MKRLLAAALCIMLFCTVFAEPKELYGCMPVTLGAYTELSAEEVNDAKAGYKAQYHSFDDEDFLDFEFFFVNNGFGIDSYSGNGGCFNLELSRQKNRVSLSYNRNANTAVFTCSDTLLDTVMHTPIQAGDCVLFGSYEQDGEAADGPERIEWIVLDVCADTAILLSRYVLDAQYFQESGQATWENSDIRAWLNNEFRSVAFDPSESARVERYRATADANPYYDTDQGNDAYDYVWLLSSAETEKYFPLKSDRMAAPTPYAYALGWYPYRDAVRWALRTVGNTTQNHAVVSRIGSLYDIYFNYRPDGIRPAIMVKLQ